MYLFRPQFSHLLGLITDPFFTACCRDRLAWHLSGYLDLDFRTDSELEIPPFQFGFLFPVCSRLISDRLFRLFGRPFPNAAEQPREQKSFLPSFRLLLASAALRENGVPHVLQIRSISDCPMTTSIPALYWNGGGGTRSFWSRWESNPRPAVYPVTRLRSYSVLSRADNLSSSFHSQVRPVLDSAPVSAPNHSPDLRRLIHCPPGLGKWETGRLLTQPSREELRSSSAVLSWHLVVWSICWRSLDQIPDRGVPFNHPVEPCRPLSMSIQKTPGRYRTHPGLHD